MLSERERRQLDDIEHDLLRDPEFAAAVADIRYGPPHPRGWTVWWLVAALWIAVAVTATAAGRYVVAAAVAVMVIAVGLVLRHAARRRD